MSIPPSVAQYKKNIEEHHFKAYKCLKCGAVIAPPSGTCYACGNNKMGWIDVSGRGKLVSFTVIHVPPDEFAAEAPYCIAVVKLEEGASVTARLIGVDPLKPQDLKIGIPLVMDYEKGKSGKVYLAFKPAR